MIIAINFVVEYIGSKVLPIAIIPFIVSICLGEIFFKHQWVPERRWAGVNMQNKCNNKKHWLDMVALPRTVLRMFYSGKAEL